MAVHVYKANAKREKARKGRKWHIEHRWQFMATRGKIRVERQRGLTGA